MLPKEVQHYLALRVRSSIRDLEGAVNRVTALARISREEITIDFAAKAMQPMTVAAPESKPAVARHRAARRGVPAPRPFAGAKSPATSEPAP